MIWRVSKHWKAAATSNREAVISKVGGSWTNHEAMVSRNAANEAALNSVKAPPISQAPITMRRIAARRPAPSASPIRWYGRGVDLQPHFAAHTAVPLPVTRDLCDRLLGLPVACDLSPGAIARVVAALATASAQGWGPSAGPSAGAQP